jgi:phosphocarrier protein
MGVMGLGVKQDMTVTITAEGDDEDLAVASLEQFFQSTL